MCTKCVEHRDGRLAALEKLALVESENRILKDIISEVHGWAVCACISTPEDMALNFPRIVEITSPNTVFTNSPHCGIEEKRNEDS